MNQNYSKKQLSFSRKILTNFCYHFQEIDSTNRWLAEQKNLPNGLIVSTDYQTQGKGRLGKSWQAKPKQSLMFSAMYKYKKKLFPITTLSLAIAVAVCRSFNKYEVANICLKWPNDLLINNQKIGGILCENVSQKVVFGIGINLHQTAADFPKALKLKATSLKLATTKSFDNFELLEKISLEIDKILLELETGKQISILQEWEVYASPSKTIIYQNKKKIREAVILGLNYQNGHLKVLNQDGSKNELFSGEITIKKFG